jgi:hypothetical protein
MRGLRRAGAAIALIVVMFAGCGGDGDDPGASATEPDAETSAPTAVPSEDTSTEAPAGDGFCAEVEGIRDRLENLEALPDVADPEAAVQNLEESVEALRSVDPPAEIAEDWSTVTEACDDVVTSLRNLDMNDPETLGQQLEDLADQMEQQSTAIDEAGTRIDQYLNDECGITFD